MNKDIILEVLGEFEENKVVLNSSQLEFIKEEYYTNIKFEYAEGHLCYIIKGKKSQVEKLKHYTGLVYEENEMSIYHNDEVLLVYNLSDVVLEFFKKLQNLEM